MFFVKYIKVKIYYEIYIYRLFIYLVIIYIVNILNYKKKKICKNYN